MEALALALLFLLGVSSSFHGSFAQPSLSDANVNELLEDLRSKGFFTGATILSLFVANSNLLAPGTTLLIPTDRSLAQGVSIDPRDYEALIKFHILETDFDFKQLRSLPVGTWIPTMLQGYGVEVTSNSPADFSLNNVKLIDDDICPRMATLGLTCQGVSAVLNPSSTSSAKPHNPPFGFAPAPASVASSPSPSPLASEPSPSIFLSPLSSPSPLASEPSPSIFLSPLSSPSALPSDSPSPTSSLLEPVALSPSPSPSPFSPVPKVPIFQAPIATPISPSSPFEIPPFFAGAPGPSESEISGAALSAVASQISTLAFATLGGIMLAMI